MISPPTDYPDSWKRGAQAAPPAPRGAPVVEALQMAVDSFVAALSESDFRALVARTRGQ
jgi:hypothetical protein